MSDKIIETDFRPVTTEEHDPGWYWKNLDDAIKAQHRDVKREQIRGQLGSSIEIAWAAFLSVAGFHLAGIRGSAAAVVGYLIGRMIVTWWRLRRLRKEEKHGDSPPV